MAFFVDVNAAKKKCCVPGCNTKTGSVFGFPNPQQQPLFFKTWLDVVQNPIFNNLEPKEIVTKYKICANHFREEDWQPRGRRGIVWNAIPQLYLPAKSKTDSIECSENQEESPSKRIRLDMEGFASSSKNTMPLPFYLGSNLDQIETGRISEEGLEKNIGLPPEVEVDTDQPLTPTSSHPKSVRRGILKEIGVTRQKCLTPRSRTLYRRVITSCSKISKQSATILDYKKG